MLNYLPIIVNVIFKIIKKRDQKCAIVPSAGCLLSVRPCIITLIVFSCIITRMQDSVTKGHLISPLNMWERPVDLFGKDNNTLQLEEVPSLLGCYAFSPAKRLPTSRVSMLPRFSVSSIFWIASHWRQNQFAFPKHRYTFTGRQSVLSKKTWIFRNAAIRISNTVNHNYNYEDINCG
jgi:hypothetical protein